MHGKIWGNKFEDLEEMDTFLGKFSLAKTTSRCSKRHNYVGTSCVHVCVFFLWLESLFE